MGKKIEKVVSATVSNVLTGDKPLRRPVNGYFEFVGELRAAMPESKTEPVVEFSKTAGRKWAELTQTQRDRYKQAAQVKMNEWKSKRPPPKPFPRDAQHIITAMQLFMMRNWDRVHAKVIHAAPAAATQDALFALTSKAISTEWRELSEDVRKPYIDDHIAHRMRVIEERARGLAMARAGVAEKAVKPKRVRAEKPAIKPEVPVPVAKPVAADEIPQKSAKKTRKERRRKEPSSESSSEEPVKKHRSKKAVQ